MDIEPLNLNTPANTLSLITGSKRKQPHEDHDLITNWNLSKRNNLQKSRTRTKISKIHID